MTDDDLDRAVDDAADFLAEALICGCALVTLLAGLGLWVVLA